MSVYYNEIDPFCAEWLRNLIALGELPEGDVDERDIRDVRPSDLDGYSQCHFFAGIGGWPLALRLAGVPDDAPLWTGSCPCQPFSTAGRRKGADDERHLWPAFRWLIDQRRPATVLGEQVASKDGRGWLAGVRADLEALGYAVGAADLCSAGTGAPHIRQRLYWLADRASERCGETGFGVFGPEERAAGRGADERLALPESEQYDWAGNAGRGRGEFANGRNAGGLGHGIGKGLEGHARDGQGSLEPGRVSAQAHGSAPAAGGFVFIPCADGKFRRAEPGIFPLAHALPRSVGPGSTKEQRVELLAAKVNRKGRLAGYGNAIDPELAAEFIRACLHA